MTVVDPTSRAGRRSLVAGPSPRIGRTTAALASRLGTRRILVGRDRGRLESSVALDLRDRHRVEAFVMVRNEMAGRIRGNLFPDRWDAVVRQHPLGLGDPRDLADAAAFLLANTGRCITGTMPVVEGGGTALWLRVKYSRIGGRGGTR